MNHELVLILLRAETLAYLPRKLSYIDSTRRPLRPEDGVEEGFVLIKWENESVQERKWSKKPYITPADKNLVTDLAE